MQQVRRKEALRAYVSTLALRKNARLSRELREMRGLLLNFEKSTRRGRNLIPNFYFVSICVETLRTFGEAC